MIHKIFLFIFKLNVYKLTGSLPILVSTFEIDECEKLKIVSKTLYRFNLLDLLTEHTKQNYFSANERPAYKLELTLRNFCDW